MYSPPPITLKGSQKCLKPSSFFSKTISNFLGSKRKEKVQKRKIKKKPRHK